MDTYAAALAAKRAELDRLAADLDRRALVSGAVALTLRTGIVPDDPVAALADLVEWQMAPRTPSDRWDEDRKRFGWG
jgi:hypothetical protein